MLQSPNEDRQVTTSQKTLPRAAPPALRGGGRWVAGIAVGVVVLVASYLLAVWTRTGQAVENAALRGADQVAAQDAVEAGETLGAITLVSLIGSMILVAVIALLRRRLDLAVAAVGVIVLGQVLTQALKRFILPRPDLVEVAGDYSHNSFPSGHTTIAVTVLFALFLVVPYRFRGVLMFFLCPWAMSIGAYTVTAKWHRFSDTAGAVAIALICACLASWWLARRGEVLRYSGPALPGRVALVVVIAVFSAVALAVGAFLWAAGLARGVDFTVADQVWEYNAYLGANALAAAVAGICTLLFWGLWHRREIT